jgi:hypothetical protein
MIDARDLKQLFKAILPILAILNFGEVKLCDRIVRQPNRTERDLGLRERLMEPAK